MKKTFVTLLALAFTAGNACSAFAAGPTGLARGLNDNSAVSYISEKGKIIPPFAQVLFCAQNPAECRDNNGLAVITLTDKEMLQLKNVNSSVNRTMVGRNDPRNELNGDVWKVNVRSGDCEDFALTKRSRLIAMGWSSRALRIATAFTPSGEGHGRPCARQQAKQHQELARHRPAMGQDSIGNRPLRLVPAVAAKAVHRTIPPVTELKSSRSNERLDLSYRPHKPMFLLSGG